MPGPTSQQNPEPWYDRAVDEVGRVASYLSGGQKKKQTGASPSWYERMMNAVDSAIGMNHQPPANAQMGQPMGMVQQPDGSWQPAPKPQQQKPQSKPLFGPLQRIVQILGGGGDQQ